MRKWVAQNVDNDPVKLFRKIYDSLYEVLNHKVYHKVSLSLQIIVTSLHLLLTKK